MKKKAYERLRPFLHRKGARQRVILYLIADGYTVGELVAMEVPALRALKLPVEIDVSRDEMLDTRKTGKAFILPNGSGMPHTTFYRLIRTTCQKVVGRPMTQEKYRKYVTNISYTDILIY